MKSVYLIGSLRNPEVLVVAEKLRQAGFDVFDNWMAAGPEADDYWLKYSKQKGLSYKEALQSYEAKHVFAFDKYHLDRCDAAVLLLPAGKSGHLEVGYVAGCGKPTYALFPPEEQMKKLPEDWIWLAGIYEGEGSLTRNGKRGGHGIQLTVSMKDKDIIERLYATSKVGNLDGPYKRANPKWADMYRWSVRKREDVLYVLRGIWKYLGERRKEQARIVLTNAGIDISELDNGNSPLEFRYDVMYQFLSSVHFSVDDLIKGMKNAS